jgi:flagellar biosynthesis chaperone FliJ
MATNFHFRLERVLRWRAVELSLEEAKLKRHMDHCARLDAALAMVKKEIAGLPARLVSLPGIHGRDLNALASYAARLAKEREKIEHRRIDAQRELQIQIEVHRGAKQRSRLLEELRNRKRDEWTTQHNRELEALAQESYLARWEEQAREV